MALAAQSVQGSRVKGQGQGFPLEPSTFNLEQDGFTFVELLIAATMMSILFVGLGAHLRGGVIVWERATQTTDLLQRQRVALDRLERDLANAIIYDSNEASYGREVGKLPEPKFEQATLAFFTVAQERRAQLPTVRFVTYRCDTIDGTPALWRTSQSVGEARAHKETAPQLLLKDCQALGAAFGYVPNDPAQPIEWKETWNNPKTELPRLVSVSIQLTADASRKLRSGGSFTRVCAIPPGELKTVGAAP